MSTRFLVGVFVVVASLLHGTQDSILFPTETIRRHVWDPVGEITVVTSSTFDEEHQSFAQSFRIEVGEKVWVPSDELRSEVAFYFDPPVRILTSSSGSQRYWVHITVRDLTPDLPSKAESTLILEFDGPEFVVAKLEMRDGASRSRKAIHGGLEEKEANQPPQPTALSRRG